LAGARVNEIAAKAEVNKRMLYHYFGSKEGLYEAVLQANLEKIYSIENKLSGGENIVEQIRETIREYFYFLADNPNFVRLMGWEFLQDSKHISRLLGRYNIYSLPEVEDVLKKGINEGIFYPDTDSKHLVLSINAMCFLYFNRAGALNSVWERDVLAPEMLERRLQHILQVVFRAILKDPVYHGI
jgi:TetR/AcrR family transcriptional regulator